MRRFVPVLVALLAGCGSSSESDKTAPFVGPWTVTTGTVGGNCPAPIGMVSFKLEGTGQTIAKGTDSDLAVTLVSGCVVKMNVMGTVATLVTTPAQSCMLMLPNGLPVMATFMAGSFTVTDKTASFTFAATGALGPLSCPVTGSGTSMKGAAPDGGTTGADATSASSD